MRPTAIARPRPLVVPPEYKAAVNVTSGFLTGDLAGKTFKGLFLAPANERYIGTELLRLVTHVPYVADRLGGRTAGRPTADIGHEPDATTQTLDEFGALDPEAAAARAAEIAAAFAYHGDSIVRLAPIIIRSRDAAINRIYREDVTIPNPLLVLHQENLSLLQEAAANLIASPEQLVPELGLYDPDTGVTGAAAPQYEYDQSSYNDGTWHPEHLFTRSERNAANPYWVPMEVNINARSGNRERAPGHRFNSPAYGVDAEVSARAGAALSSSQFPHWQASQPGRNGQTRTPQGLREGGEGDRRTQWSRGSQMADLRSKSYY